MRISSSDGSAVWPALGGIEAFGFPAVAVFLRAASALFRIVDARAGVGVFLIFIWEVDPPASGGPPPISAWTILFFFGTDWVVLMISIRLLCIGRLASCFSGAFGTMKNRNNFFA